MTAARRIPGSTPLIRWDLTRDDKHVMCTIQGRPSESLYELAIVPLWDIGRSAVETFTSATAALRRHAVIAAELRDAGWRIAAYSS